MKKRIGLFCTAMFVTVQYAFAAFSSIAPNGQRLFYDIISGNSVTVVRPTSFGNIPTGNLIIPNSVVYGGITYNVTAIGDSAFYG